MKLWPLNRDRLETRSSSQTDTQIQALVSRASGTTLPIPSATGAVESCAGLIGRGFAACEIGGPESITSALTPNVMEMVGRALMRTGSLVFLIDTQGGMLKVFPAESHDVDGDADPTSWTYRVTLGGPSRTFTHDHVPAASVLHFRYASEPSTPWRGNSPLTVASLAGKLSAETVNALSDESSGPVGALLGIPKDGNDETVTNLKSDIRNARGRVALLESGDWDNAGSARVALKTERFGAEPGQPLVNLHEMASREVYAACGLSPSLFQVGPAAALREAWRLCLFSVLSPLGRMVQAELRDKLDGGLTLGWQELRASDLSGRARAMQSMVGGGMDLAQAVAIAGLMVDE